MLDCRPFHVAGFNAHDVVPKSMAELYDHQTIGARYTRPAYPAFSNACSYGDAPILLPMLPRHTSHVSHVALGV